MLRYTVFVTSTGKEVFTSVACVLFFVKKFMPGVSFLDSFQNSATFLLANEKVIFRSLSVPKFKRWTVVDDLIKQIFSYEGE